MCFSAIFFVVVVIYCHLLISELGVLFSFRSVSVRGGSHRHHQQSDYVAWTLKRPCFSFCQYPFVLDIATKSFLLNIEADARMKNAYKQEFINRRTRSKYLELYIQRNHIIESTLSQLMKSPHDLKKPVSFLFRAVLWDGAVPHPCGRWQGLESGSGREWGAVESQSGGGG